MNYFSYLLFKLKCILHFFQVLGFLFVLVVIHIIHKTNLFIHPIFSD